ncbi:hypothetical protein [Streptomyces cavernicola]|uniref:Uncharacterized protein n=1 Tax=Streptomyces cavernicola TaxID=3043613 RepID=A0ABT6S918_9ACTN|nr:hypothetical protein [Streptomyces sp. B-S-A6]MDI3404593.1 hypothetical protein [Streptomyces sp. B-S-A6]
MSGTSRPPRIEAYDNAAGTVQAARAASRSELSMLLQPSLKSKSKSLLRAVAVLAVVAALAVPVAVPALDGTPVARTAVVVGPGNGVVSGAD